MDTYILGAGFSYSFAQDLFPLTETLVRKGIEKFSHPKSYGALKGLISRMFDDSESINFERLATFLLNDPLKNIIGNSLTNYQIYLDLIGLVANVLNVDQALIKKSENYSLMQNWLSKLNGSGDTIITFNYDLILEQVLSELKWDPLAGYCMDFFMPGIDRIYPWVEPKANQLKYLKLHGSLNWQMEKDAFYDVSDKRIFFSLNDLSRPWQDSYQGYYKERYSYYPYIIPPLIGKKYENKSIQHLWHISQALLENSKRIFIIGYSLPESDVIAEFMLRDANISNKEIKIVRKIGKNESKTEVEDRFKGIFFSQTNNNRIELIDMDAMEFIGELGF
ncbi:SIR2 family protein [Leptospira kanakyensis]|uniref:SIR2 family protein n=1 Tax=Leptospira kanakyensis TaxID=2484968 RepID=UPI00223DC8CE|nr:SIR2 family protein [Leptospira kanakyensis]MCW7469594.1 SIR2 family protein [Leptospira kanakyensis]